jgi:hypothetical protein
MAIIFKGRFMTTILFKFPIPKAENTSTDVFERHMQNRSDSDFVMQTGDAMGAGYLVQMSLQWLKRKTGVINVSVRLSFLEACTRHVSQ